MYEPPFLVFSSPDGGPKGKHRVQASPSEHVMKYICHMPSHRKSSRIHSWSSYALWYRQEQKKTGAMRTREAGRREEGKRQERGRKAAVGDKQA
jgi:hypothetical protein